MIYDQLRELVAALNAQHVRYLIVGGLAVVAHGYRRLTGDVDVVFDFAAENLRRAIEVFEQLGYRSRAPVPLAAFADAEQRWSWRNDKDMLVFSVWRTGERQIEVDWFLEAPFDFAAAYPQRLCIEVDDGVPAPFVDLDTLLRMKQHAGRAKDLEDLRILRALHSAGGDAAGDPAASS